ncbi:MAG: hypothetical protein M1503_07310 [Thaumarchaeota archaeon]|nr:hypothetical protein [Nitrososphaerota archaeon]MCL5318049.1 hypothetical protein [Nitrososphaerota archaeon]
MSKVKSTTRDFSNLKTRVEILGLVLSLAGLAAILQPVSLFLYSYGFYILVLGAAVSLLGGAILESSSTGHVTIRIISFFAIVIIILILSILMAPFLVE